MGHPVCQFSQSGYPAEFARQRSEYSYKHPARGSPIRCDDDNAYLITEIGYFRTQDATTTTTSKDFPSMDRLRLRPSYLTNLLDLPQQLPR